MSTLFSDDSIFHYTSIETCFNKIIKSNSLKASNPIFTNDPHEFERLTFVIGSSWLNNGIDTPIDNSMFLEELLLEKEQVKFISFCKNPLIQSPLRDPNLYNALGIRYGFQKYRMWAQYANNHQGVCLVFSKTALLQQTLKVLLKQENHTNVRFIEIKYYNFLNFENIRQVDLTNCNNIEPKIFAINYYLSNQSPYAIKDNDYKDESEIRLIFVTEGLM